MVRGHVDMEWLLDYQLRLAIRYLRVLSVVMVAAGDSAIRIGSALKPNVRGCDEFFDFGEWGVIVMAETSLAQALNAVNRFRDLCRSDVDVRYAAGSFPNDGKTATRLLSNTYERLKQAQKLGPGAVVAAGEPLGSG
ncbi:MAG: hypothetical protein NTW86_25440 [Candidatus Sumerlaeota bacterium]|nr:hypothetical protein [Candidatus Sumerlaeota bacterium]